MYVEFIHNFHDMITFIEFVGIATCFRTNNLFKSNEIDIFMTLEPIFMLQYCGQGYSYRIKTIIVTLCIVPNFSANFEQMFFL